MATFSVEHIKEYIYIYFFLSF